MTSPVVRRVNVVDEAMVGALADLLKDCVDGGASVSFMHPLTHERATAFWRKVAEGVAAGQRALIVAEDAHGCAPGATDLRSPETSRIAPICEDARARRARRTALAGPVQAAQPPLAVLQALLVPTGDRAIRRL